MVISTSLQFALRRPWLAVLLPSLILVLSTALATSTDCTPKPTDIVFVLDESGSVGDTNFEIQNEFVAKFVDGFTIGPDANHVAVLTFSSGVVIEFYLNKYNDKTQLMESIKQINYSHPGLTLTHRALNTVSTDVLTVANGMRPDALPYVIVMTDGKSMSKISTAREAKKLHDMNVTVFAIGISKEVNEEELKEIATDPKNVILVQDFGALMSVQKQTFGLVCEAIKKEVYGSKYVMTPSTILPEVFLDLYNNFTCSFENDYLCGLTFQLSNANKSWVISNGTRFDGIGPHYDNTFQNKSGKFIFVDGSTTQPNISAYIFTPMINFRQSQTICLKFYFQMFGNDTKLLNVYTTNSSQRVPNSTPIWSEANNDTLGWTVAEVMQITSFNSSERIVFEAVNITTENGIAIDDISLWDCPERIRNSSLQITAMTTKTKQQQPSTTTTTTTTTTTMYPAATYPYSSTGSLYWTDSSSNSPQLFMTKTSLPIHSTKLASSVYSQSATTPSTPTPTTPTPTTTPTSTTETMTTTTDTYQTTTVFSSSTNSGIFIDSSSNSPQLFMTKTSLPIHSTKLASSVYSQSATTPSTPTPTTPTPTTTPTSTTETMTTTTDTYQTTTVFSSSTNSGIFIDSSSVSRIYNPTRAQTTSTTTKHPKTSPSTILSTFSTEVLNSYPFTNHPMKPFSSSSTKHHASPQIQTKTSRATTTSSPQGTTILRMSPTYVPGTVIRVHQTTILPTKKTTKNNDRTKTTNSSNSKMSWSTLQNLGRLTSKLDLHLQSSPPSNRHQSKANISHSQQQKFLIPSYFQYVEIGLIAITTIVGIGLLGCCCLKFCGGKRNEDDDEEEAVGDKSAGKTNDRLPISKPNGWIKGLQF